jgi:hypothetical protein
MNKGCSTMIAIKIQKRDEKSTGMASVPWLTGSGRHSKRWPIGSRPGKS